jgi:50S ribosomal protein L16 3-hydroxylase
VGFRAPDSDSLAADVVQRMVDAVHDERAFGDDGRKPLLYRDPREEATAFPARIPPSLQGFADAAVTKLLGDARERACALGEALSEPKPGTWFDAGGPLDAAADHVALDRRTRMLYDDHHVFINGESYRTGGRDATLMRRLADRRRLDRKALAQLSPEAGDLLAQWSRAGWLGAAKPTEEGTT